MRRYPTVHALLHYGSIGLLTLASTLPIRSQEQEGLHGTVVDSVGRPLPGARVVMEGPAGEAVFGTDKTGTFRINYPAGWTSASIRASEAGLTSDEIQLTPQSLPADLVLTLHPTPVREETTVTATRSSLDLPATGVTLYALGSEALQDYPATALDDRLRQQAGFELFRRASSNVSNPTTQGISLRGLGSTAVSRTLVLERGVPMNDPFGGWIHWDAIPEKVIDAVDLATGGGSDLYGSSALGGVIDIVPAKPTTGELQVRAFGGGQDTSLVSMRGDFGSARWRQLVATDEFRNGGYIPTAPAAMGPIDMPAHLHYENGRTETDHVIGANNSAFLVGTLLNEARSNGTRLQTNGTRLWRYAAGEDWAARQRATGRARVFGSNEAYRQSFSAINGARTTESLTRLQHVRTQELGGSTDASFSFAPAAVVTGFDVRDLRATDDETPITSGAPSGIANNSARQRFIGGFGEVVGSRGRWSGAASLRLDGAWNLATRTLTEPSSVVQPAVTPNRSEFIASPRIGIVRQLGSSVNMHASVFRAFRTPTMNELYRTGQVGQEITQANPQLESERATGAETGAKYDSPGGGVGLQATYFWTEINRGVSAVLISSTPTSILDKRENLGQIVSQGTELHAELRPRRFVSASIGYQYAHAIVTRFSAQPALVDRWIPQVPRHSFTAQVRAQQPAIGEITIATRASGHAYDDSANTYVLRRFFQLDFFARHDFGAHWSASVSVQNLLDERPDVARTPILSLGSPRVAQGGIDFHWSRLQPH